MDDKKLREILDKHRDWVYGQKGGERANLYGADLYGANLTRANLCGANLSGANLYEANLKKTILEGINGLAYIGIVPDHQGTARAYKVLTRDGVGPFQGGINYLENNVFESALDYDASVQC